MFCELQLSIIGADLQTQGVPNRMKIGFHIFIFGIKSFGFNFLAPLNRSEKLWHSKFGIERNVHINKGCVICLFVAKAIKQNLSCILFVTLCKI